MSHFLEEQPQYREGDIIQFASPKFCSAEPIWEGGKYEHQWTEKDAHRLDSFLRANKEKAREQNCRMPWGDFDHEEAKVLCYAKCFGWGGDEDGRAGGVQMFVQWTAPGIYAVCSDIPTHFSPHLIVNRSSHEISGLPHNVGGIVTKTAFTNNWPIQRHNLLRGTKEKALRYFKEIERWEKEGRRLTDATDFIMRHLPELRAAYVAVETWPEIFIEKTTQELGLDESAFIRAAHEPAAASGVMPQASVNQPENLKALRYNARVLNSALNHKAAIRFCK